MPLAWNQQGLSDPQLFYVGNLVDADDLRNQTFGSLVRHAERPHQDLEDVIPRLHRIAKVARGVGGALS